MPASIIGWSHLPFGRFDARTLEDLIVEAAQGAMVHAGVEPSQIDEIVLGHFNAGFSPPASLMIRMRRLSDRFAKMRAQQAQERTSAETDEYPEYD